MRSRFLIVWGSTSIVAFTGAAIGQSVYVGATGSNWGTAANWSPSGVPTSTTDAIVNNAASDVTVLVNVGANVRALTIGAGDGVSVNNGQRLALFGDLLNNGLLRVNSPSSNTYLQPSGTITLNGSGIVELADTNTSLECWFYDVNNVNAADDHIINSASHTIRGIGTIGFSTTTQITNHGLIHANVSALPLRVIPNAQGLLNTGTLLSSNGAILYLNGSGLGNVYTNTGGTIESASGSTIFLESTPRIFGGTVQGAGSFNVPSGQRGIYDSLTHSSSTTINNSGRLDLVGTIVNNGVITVSSPSSNTYLQPSGTVTLQGSGSVVLADPGTSIEAWFYDSTNANAASDHIINAASHTIRGVGTVGFSTTTQITNQGLILADGIALPLRLIPNASGLLNTGTMRASGTGNLVLDGSNSANVFTNTGATIEAEATATVTLDNTPRIVGGTLSGAGAFTVPGGERGIYESLTHTAATTVANSGRLDLVGTIVNNGVITVSSPSSNTYLQPSGVVTLNGTGAVVLADPGVNIEAWFYDSTNANAATDHIINSSTHTIRGAGNIGFSTTTQITNNGLIHADVNTLPLNVLPNAAGMVNNGTLRASGGGTLTLSRGEVGAIYSGAGALDVQIDSVIQFANGATGSLGTATGAGTLRATGAGTNLSVLNFDVGVASANSSGILRITAGGGNAGTSRTGSITLSTSGKLDITDHGLIVTGMTDASVRALLSAGRAAGAWNGSNGIGSSLANNNGKAVGYTLASDLFSSPGTFLGASFGLTDVLVRYTVNGDANLDGAVTFDDLLIEAQNYGLTTTGKWSNGDFNYDAKTNFDDLLIIAQQYGSSLALGSVQWGELTDGVSSSFAADWRLAVSLVPEPTTALLMFLLGNRRRR